MEFKEEYREPYKRMTAEDKKTFRTALEDDDRHTVKMLLCAYQGAAPKKRGAKNRGLTAQRKKEWNEFRYDLRTTPQGEMIEKVEGEIIETDDIEQFKELYKTACYSVLNQFQQENEELCKKHPYMWYKKILIRIKQYAPKVNKQSAEQLEAVWDILKDFMADIGLYVTYETFQNICNVYDYQLVKMGEVSPKHAALRKKIFTERDQALMDELQHNPFSQPNKIFVAKTHGIIEKTENKTVEVIHSVKQIDDIPIFEIEEKEEKDKMQ